MFTILKTSVTYPRMNIKLWTFSLISFMRKWTKVWLNQTWESKRCRTAPCQVIILFCHHHSRENTPLDILCIHSISTSVQDEHILCFVTDHLSGQKVTILPTSVFTVSSARKVVFVVLNNKSTLIKLVRSRWLDIAFSLLSHYKPPTMSFWGSSRTPPQMRTVWEATCCVLVHIKTCKKTTTCSTCTFYILMQ